MKSRKLLRMLGDLVGERIDLYRPYHVADECASEPSCRLEGPWIAPSRHINCYDFGTIQGRTAPVSWRACLIFIILLRRIETIAFTD